MLILLPPWINVHIPRTVNLPNSNQNKKVSNRNLLLPSWLESNFIFLRQEKSLHYGSFFLERLPDQLTTSKNRNCKKFSLYIFSFLTQLESFSNLNSVKTLTAYLETAMKLNDMQGVSAALRGCCYHEQQCFPAATPPHPHFKKPLFTAQIQWVQKKVDNAC